MNTNQNYLVERWADIPNYEGKYIISDLGNVAAIGKLTGSYCPSKPYKNADGYLVVGLAKDNDQRFFLVHRLVAASFIPNDENLPIVDHIDTNRRNNHWSNLRWASYLMNYHNPISMNKRRKIKSFDEKLREKEAAHGVETMEEWKPKKMYSKKVNQVDLQGNIIQTFRSQNEAVKISKVFSNIVSGCLKGDIPYFKNFTFKYAS